MDNAQNEVQNDEGKTMEGSVKAGYIVIGLSLILFPLFLGLAGFIIGIINVAKNETGHGTTQIALSIICAIVGVILGMSI